MAARPNTNWSLPHGMSDDLSQTRPLIGTEHMHEGHNSPCSRLYACGIANYKSPTWTQHINALHLWAYNIK